MNAMTAPDVWSGQDRALTVEDMAVARADSLGTVFQERPPVQAARVAGDEAFRAGRPFPVTVTPSALVRAGR